MTIIETWEISIFLLLKKNRAPLRKALSLVSFLVCRRIAWSIWEDGKLLFHSQIQLLFWNTKLWLKIKFYDSKKSPNSTWLFFSGFDVFWLGFWLSFSPGKWHLLAAIAGIIVTNINTHVLMDALKPSVGPQLMNERTNEWMQYFSFIGLETYLNEVWFAYSKLPLKLLHGVELGRDWFATYKVGASESTHWPLIFNQLRNQFNYVRILPLLLNMHEVRMLQRL